MGLIPTSFSTCGFPSLRTSTRSFSTFTADSGELSTISTTAGHLCWALTAQGVATANLEYRRVGDDGGGWPGTFADVRAAYNFLMQRAASLKLDRGRVVVMGHSAGGQLALCLAAHEPSVTRVVSLAGVVDLQRAYQLHLSNDAVVEFLGGKPAEVADHYREADPMELSIAQARQWLVHGSVDDVVPVGFSRDYVAAKQKRLGRDKEDAHLLEIPGAGHFDVIDPGVKPGRRLGLRFWSCWGEQGHCELGCLGVWAKAVSPQRTRRTQMKRLFFDNDEGARGVSLSLIIVGQLREDFLALRRSSSVDCSA